MGCSDSRQVMSTDMIAANMLLNSGNFKVDDRLGVTETLLNRACQSGDLKLVQMLLMRGANPHLVHPLANVRPEVLQLLLKNMK